MPYQLFIGFTVLVGGFFLLLVFRNSLNKYAFAHPKRLGFLAVVLAFGGKLVFYVLPFYALFFFFREYKASQAVADTASSKISSAAQGYVEIIGQGSAKHAIRSPVGNRPCLWYSFEEWEVPNNFLSRLHLNTDNWKRIDYGQSEIPFGITDGKAHCFVDPKGAQISDLHFETWFERDRFYKLATLVPNKPVYVLGQFVTESEGKVLSTNSRKIGELIAEWKQHYPDFLQRFDLDGDGEISQQELDLARSAAIRALKNDGELQTEVKSVISKPNDRRPFIISHHPHDTLIKRHRWHARFYLALFIVSSAMLALLMMKHHHAPKVEENYPVGWAALDIDETHLFCPDLTGQYQLKADAGRRQLSETFLGDLLFKERDKPFYRDWDMISIREERDRNLSWVYITAYRTQATMNAYENDLQEKDPEGFAEYTKLRSPEIRAKQYLKIETRNNAGYREYSPYSMNAKEWEQVIDDYYLGSVRVWKLRKYEAPYHCHDGRVTYALKQPAGQSPTWLTVGLNRDKDGNLIAKTYTIAPQEWHGIRLPEKVTVFDWTRFPKADFSGLLDPAIAKYSE